MLLYARLKNNRQTGIFVCKPSKEKLKIFEIFLTTFSFNGCNRDGFHLCFPKSVHVLANYILMLF